MPEGTQRQTSETRRPTPTLLVFGLKPERLIDREGRIDAFVEPPTQEQLEVLIEAVRSGAEEGGHVVAIVPQWLKGEGLQRLQMVQSALDDETLTIHESALPPLAGTVLASLASSVAPHVPGTGVLVSLLPELEAQLHVFTWLGSVSKLTVPAPTMGQHLSSLSPGSAFGVSSFPEPSVHKLGRDGGVPLPQIERPAGMVISDHGGDVAWIHTLNAQLGNLPVRQVEPTPNGPAWWGTGKLVESVVHPLDVDALGHQLTEAAAPWTCRWCRELIARSPCPLCGHRGRPPRRRNAQPAQHGART